MSQVKGIGLLANQHAALIVRPQPHYLLIYYIWDIMGRDGLIESDRKKKKQRGRLFHRLVTGFYYHRNKEFRFLTLSSSPDSPLMRDSFKELVKRIRRKYGYFEYFAVFTDEGHGVVHCVFVGSYIPYEWLTEQWSEIHNAWNVSISSISRYDEKKRRKKAHGDHTEALVYYPPGLARYVLTQYVKDQNAIRTINWSRGWVYSGFVDDWREMKRRHKGEDMKTIVKAWHAFLDDARFPQKTLS